MCARLGADAHPAARLRHQRTENRLPDRLHDLSALSHHRPGGGERADVDGHDDALAADHLTAVQDHALRACRWLVVDRRIVVEEFQLATGTRHD